MNKLAILIVNINNSEHLNNILEDLSKQNNMNFDLCIIDQGSTENILGIISKFKNHLNINFIQNGYNKNLNSVWNDFHEMYKNELLLFLNNDIRISNNFVNDTIISFERYENVGIVCHSTNHPSYNIAKKQLDIRIVPSFLYKQGWDFCIRRILYKKIPDVLTIYCGDDFIFEHVYRQNYNFAFILSSPIIHYQGESIKFLTTQPNDVSKYVQLGYTHNLKTCADYTRIKPTFKKIL